MRVVVIGAGHVGLVTAGALASFGHDVVAVDEDEEKINGLGSGVLLVARRRWQAPLLLGLAALLALSGGFTACELGTDTEAQDDAEDIAAAVTDRPAD